MVKIKIAKGFSYVTFLSVIAIILLTIAYFLHRYSNLKFGDLILIDTVLLGVFLAPFCICKHFFKSEYVSELIIADDELQLAYRIQNKEIHRIERIPKSDIAKIIMIQYANLDAGRRATGILFYSSKTTIYLTDGDTVEFSESDLDCKFLFKMLAARNLLPNFMYIVEANHKNIGKGVEKDIEHYIVTGKRLPFYRLSHKLSQLFRAFLWVFIFGALLLVFISIS